MKKLTNDNINTREYWDSCYGSELKRTQYAAQGTCADVTSVRVEDTVVNTTQRFYRALEEVEDGDTVLDIGCGVGVFTNLVFRNRPGCEVWGVDISAKAMHDNTLENPYIKYIEQVVGNLDKVPKNYFNVVFSGETLEHLDDPNDLFKDAYSVLKFGGKFVLTTPLTDRIKSSEHTWEFDHEDIKELYTKNGFERVRFVYLPNREHLLVIFAIGFKK